MWNKLSDPCHAINAVRLDFYKQGLSEVLAKVATCDYAEFVFGHWSHQLFIVGTAPSYSVSDSKLHQNILLIVSEKDGLEIGFGETPTSEWGIKQSEGKIIRKGCWIKCDADTAVRTIGAVIRGVLDVREPGWHLYDSYDSEDEFEIL